MGPALGEVLSRPCGDISLHSTTYGKLDELGQLCNGLSSAVVSIGFVSA